MQIIIIKKPKQKSENKKRKIMKNNNWKLRVVLFVYLWHIFPLQKREEIIGIDGWLIIEEEKFFFSHFSSFVFI